MNAPTCIKRRRPAIVAAPNRDLWRRGADRPRGGRREINGTGCHRATARSRTGDLSIRHPYHVTTEPPSGLRDTEATRLESCNRNLAGKSTGQVPPCSGADLPSLISHAGSSTTTKILNQHATKRRVKCDAYIQCAEVCAKFLATPLPVFVSNFFSGGHLGGHEGSSPPNN